MRIVCPACSAAYDVPDAQLSEGRVVRCARCGTDWAPVVAVPEPEPEPKPPPIEPEAAGPSPGAVWPVRAMALPADDTLPSPMAAPILPPPSAGAVKRQLPLLAIAWAFSIVVLLAAVVEAYAARDGIMRAWPPSIRAYAALGLARGP